MRLVVTLILMKFVLRAGYTAKGMYIHIKSTPRYDAIWFQANSQSDVQISPRSQSTKAKISHGWRFVYPTVRKL